MGGKERRRHVEIHLDTMIPRIFPVLVSLCLCWFVFASENQKVLDIDTIWHEGESYPRIFEPTTEFKVIKQGQEIPPGTLLIPIPSQSKSKSLLFSNVQVV